MQTTIFEELTVSQYLRQLSEKLMGVPGIYGVDQADCDELDALARQAKKEEKLKSLDTYSPGWRDMKHDNGKPKFSTNGMLLDENGNRSIFDDVDEQGVESMTNGEPIVHSHISDVLATEHPLANKTVYCDHDNGACQAMLHASNNECMQTWFETTEGNFCTKHMIFNEVTARGIK